MKALEDQIHFYLYTTFSRQQHHALIKTISKPQLHALLEVVFNVLSLARATKVCLAVIKKIIRQVVDRRASVKKKQNLLQKYSNIFRFNYTVAFEAY